VQLAAVTRRYVPPDTGDPLTDAVLDVLLSEYLSNPELLEVALSDNLGYYSCWFRGIPSENGAGISALYDQFASDPRYWQALAMLEPSPRYSRHAYLSQLEFRRSIWEQALDHGATDSRLRQLKLNDDIAYYGLLALTAAEAGQLQGTTLTPEEQRALFTGNANNIDERMQKRLARQQHIDHVFPELNAQLAELRELDGDECYPWYASAFAAFCHGDYEQTLYYLECGNKAENVLQRDWFFIDEIVELGVSGEITAAGLLRQKGTSSYLGYDTESDLAQQAVLRKDTDLLDALHRFGCRLELTPFSNSMDMTFPLVSKLYRAHKNNSSGALTAGQTELHNLVIDLLKLDSRIQDEAGGWLPTLKLSDPVPAKPWRVIRAMLGFERSKRQQYLEWLVNFEVTQAQFQQQRAAIVREMQGFSYQELGWPEDTAASDENATARGGA
jgi:hypothetical protein